MMNKREAEIVKQALDFISSTNSYKPFHDWMVDRAEFTGIEVDYEQLADELEVIWEKIRSDE